MLDLLRGPLVLAHSDHLDEVSHGAARGRVRSQTLEQLREVAPELPTLDEALAFFVDEAPDVGLHVDLKLRVRLDELAAAIVRHGLEARTVVSGVHIADLLAVGRAAPKVRLGITYPEDKLSISRKPYLWPIVSLGLTSMRASVPMRVPRLARLAGASAVMLQHRLVTASAVERAHAAGLPVLGLDGRRAGRPRPRRRGRCRRGDHERSDDLRGYTGGVNRGVTIAALSSCGAAGVIVALLLATAPGAGADDGTTTGTTATTPTTTAATTTTPTTTTPPAATAAEGHRRGREGRRHARRRPHRHRGPRSREAALRSPADARRRHRRARHRDAEGARSDAGHRQGRQSCGPRPARRLRRAAQGRGVPDEGRAARHLARQALPP